MFRKQRGGRVVGIQAMITQPDRNEIWVGLEYFLKDE